MFGAPSADVDAFASARGAFRTLEGQLVRPLLDGHTFLAACGPTIADIACLPAVALANDFAIGKEEFPRLLSRARQIHALNGFITMPGVREVI